MILIIDHYDSFVHNLARYFEQLGETYRIARWDEISVGAIEEGIPKAIVLSPGPCVPQDAPTSIEIVQHFYRTLPILGVCLGHQIIAEALGGKTCKAPAPHHGKASTLHHDNDILFQGIPSPFMAGRYHSLISDVSSAPDLIPIVHTEDALLMGFKHKTAPTYGLQFHPESILTDHGLTLLKNFIRIGTS